MWEAPVWEWQRLMMNGCIMATMPQVSVEQYRLRCPYLTAALKPLQTRITPEGCLLFFCWKSCLGNTHGHKLRGCTEGISSARLLWMFLSPSIPPGNGHRDIALPLANMSSRWFSKQSVRLCQQRQGISQYLPLRKGKVMMIGNSVGSERARYYSD